MVQYLIMDETHVLPYCLHGGPIPVSDLADPQAARDRIEAEKGLPHGPVVEFLRAVSQVYGATGVMAVDGDAIIGKVRFAPTSLLPKGSGCAQSADEVNKIAAIDLGRLTPRDELSPKSLFIWCLQLASAQSSTPSRRFTSEYAGRGIGMKMLSMAIDWARKNGWEEVHAMASRHIRPLLDWTGMPSMDRLSRLGFIEVSHSVSPELKEGVIAMRGGYHGEEVRKQWEQYLDLSDDEASWVYDAILGLRLMRTPSATPRSSTPDRPPPDICGR